MRNTATALLLLFLSVFSFTPTFAEDEKNCVAVEKADGEVSYFLFTDKPVISFATGKFKITTTDSLVISFDEVRKVCFTAYQSSSVNAVKVKETVRFVDGQTIEITGPQNVGVAVYSIGGMKMPAAVTRHNGGATVSIAGLAPGVYIIRTNHQSFKIQKR